MLSKLLDTLDKIGLEPTAEDVADLLWLADLLPAPQVNTAQTTASVPLGVAPPLQASNEGTPRPSLPPNRREQFVTLHDEESTASQAASEKAKLYPIQAAGGSRLGGNIGRRTGATLFRSAAAYALPAPLELGRSLRPLNRRTPSHTQTTIDEIATAEQIADNIAIFGARAGFWAPVVKPVPERWLELALVVDESSSMSVWERTIAEFVTLLERQGAFRDLQSWGLRSDPAATQPESAAVQLYMGFAASGQRDRLRKPGELLDERGQRLILVLSDCVAPIWHNGKAADLLMRWGQHGPVALVQMLPERIWQRTGLRNFPPLHLRSPQPAAINRNLETFWSSDWFDPPANGLPLPVLTLEADWLGNWARAVAGNSGLWLPGVLLHGEAASVMPTSQERSAEELVSTFYATASPLAQQLAIYLACAPLTLPIMRLVQRVMLPQARQVHLAEVLVSGLIVRPTSGAVYEPADLQNFSFVQGVRELLLNNLRRYEMERVGSAISTYVGERSGKQILDFGALLADPEAEGDLTLDETYQSFAEVTAAVLRRFGSQYARTAARLERTIYGREVHKPGTPSTVSTDKDTSRKAERPIQSSQTTTIHALLIGINHYAEPGVTPLNSCVTDVELTQSWLQERFQLSLSYLQRLTEQQATKYAILSALNKIAEQAQAGDHVYIHYSGRDQAIATDDPHEGDGLEETLFVYDSKPGDRTTLIPYRELADMLRKIDQRGAQVVLVLDTCRSGSGYLCRHNLGNILVIASSHEAEQSYEGSIGNARAGYASYFLAEAMKKYQPGMTWAEVFDSIYVNVKTKQANQTPQLIGPRDLCVFSEEHKAVAPYLLVTEATGNEIKVSVHPALMIEPGAHLALFPPGSDMSGLPIHQATVQSVAQESVTATLESVYQQESSQLAVAIGSRVQILAPREDRLLTVGWDSQQPAPTNDPLLQFVSLSEPADYRVRIERDPPPATSYTKSPPSSLAQWIIEDSDGRIVWQAQLEEQPNAMEQTNQVRDLLRSIARYRHVFMLQPSADENDLADAIELTVLSSEKVDEGTIIADQPTQVRLRNRSEADLYISLWTLDNHLGVQRIYPPADDCLLLGKGHQIQLAMTLGLSDPDQAEEQITFKVFASRTPADLSTLQQARAAQAVDLGDLQNLFNGRTQQTESTSSPARKRPTRKQRPSKVQSTVDSNAPYGGSQAADSRKLWPNGSTLRVYFLGGDPMMQEQVMQVAQEWSQYANISFQQVDDPAAEIRISFEPNTGAWSYIGTDAALPTLKDKATMNLGWLKADNNTKEIQRVVLHEFGLALGLINAHLSPAANIPWNETKVFEYYRRTSGWDEKLVRNNLLTKAKVDRYAPPDPKSIMQFPIPKELTDGKFEVGTNYELSEGDKRFIAELYPKPRAAA
ncbi:MAG: SAV_2336 N-terminal domain-related protein [Caldilineaceae bacterium]